MQDVPFGVAIVPEGTPMLAEGQGFDVSRVGIEGDDDLVDGPVIHRAQVRRGQSYGNAAWHQCPSRRPLFPAPPVPGHPMPRRPFIVDSALITWMCPSCLLSLDRSQTLVREVCIFLTVPSSRVPYLRTSSLFLHPLRTNPAYKQLSPRLRSYWFYTTLLVLSTFFTLFMGASLGELRAVLRAVGAARREREPQREQSFLYM